MNKEFWLHTIFRPLVVAAMVGSVAVSVVGLIRIFFSEWSGVYLVGATVLASLEASYSRRLIRARGLRGLDKLYFRVVELLTIFILLKAATYVGLEWSAIVADVRSWPQDPLSIFSLETIFAFGLVFISWDLTNQTMSELERVNERPEFRTSYVHPRESLGERYFLGGIILLTTAGITQIGLTELLDLERASVHGILVNVLVYFLLGVVLLAQVYYDTLRKRWQTDEIDVTPELPRRWIVYSVVLVLVGAFVAFVLPTGYTVGIFGIIDVFLGILGSVMGLLWYIVMALFLLFMLPMLFLASLLFGEEMTPPDIGPPPELIPPATTASGGGPAWFELLRSLIFWLVVVGIVAYILRLYLRDHPEVRHAITSLWPLRVLRRLLLALRRWFGDWSEAVAARLPRDLGIRFRGGTAGSGRSRRLFRLSELSPSERVRYYFLSIVERAGRYGVPRRRSETPYEYEQTLERKLRRAQREMADLTDAFVEARYSRHDIDADELARITEDWKRVRAAIRELKREREAERSEDEG